MPLIVSIGIIFLKVDASVFTATLMINCDTVLSSQLWDLQNFAMLLGVCRPIVSKVSCGRGAGHTHTVAVASNCAIECGPVCTSVHQFAIECVQTDQLCQLSCGRGATVPATHTQWQYSLHRQPASSLCQTNGFLTKNSQKLGQFWSQFGHSLTALSICQTQFCDKKSVLWREQNRYIFCGRRGMLWVCQVCSSLSKTFGTRTDDVSMSNLHWLLW